MEVMVDSKDSGLDWCGNVPVIKLVEIEGPWDVQIEMPDRYSTVVRPRLEMRAWELSINWGKLKLWSGWVQTRIVCDRGSAQTLRNRRGKRHDRKDWRRIAGEVDRSSRGSYVIDPEVSEYF